MASFRGTVQHNDLEGGFLELHCEDGSIYRLSGVKPPVGERVVVEGEVEGGGFGIHMSGPSIAASGWKSA